MATSINELWGLLLADQHDVDVIMQFINEHPSYCSIAVDNELPIHRAIKNMLSMDVLRKMLSCYPDCCMMIYEGNLLLHHLLCLPVKINSSDKSEYRIPDDIIMSIIDSNPYAVNWINVDDGMFPVHIECDHACRYDVIIKLVTIYPGALAIACKNGYLPLHSALSNHHSTSDVIIYMIDQCQDAVFARYDGSLPIHLECEHQCRYDVIKKLLEIYPESIKSTDEFMHYPLHLACESHESKSDVVIYLINLYEDAARMSDSYHEYLLHLECEHYCRYDVVMRLLQVYPESISVPSGYYECLPLHYATLSKSCEALAVIPMLVSRYPDAVQIVAQGYPFMMMFDKYYKEYSDIEFYRLYPRRYLMPIKAMTVDILNLYPRAMYVPDNNLYIDPAIRSDTVKYRLLMNMACYHLKSPNPRQIRDYHDMNYCARSSILHLIYALSSSRKLCKHEDNIEDDVICIIGQNHCDNMKYKWLWQMMVLAGCNLDKHEDQYQHMHASFGWMKGYDIGQHLLRCVVGYL